MKTPTKRSWVLSKRGRPTFSVAQTGVVVDVSGRTPQAKTFTQNMPHNSSTCDLFLQGIFNLPRNEVSGWTDLQMDLKNRISSPVIFT